MSIDLLSSIKQAESEAERIKKQSLDDSRQTLSEASNQSYKLLEQAIEDAEKESKDIIREAEKLASAEIEKLNEEVEEECDVIRNHGRKKLDKAIEIIMGRIVKIHGDS